MFSKRITINLDKKDDTIHIEPLGDIHVGHVGFDPKHYSQRVNAIANDPNRFTLFMGDQLDAINIYDKRFNPDAVIIHEIDDQRQVWQNLTQPLIDEHLKRCIATTVEQKTFNRSKKELLITKQKIKTLKKGENPKIWGLLHGNHEYKIKEITRAYLENHFCYPNGIDFMGAKCYIALDIAHKGKILGQWDIMAMHGSGGSKPETMLQQMKQNNFVDIYFCGHLHQKFYKVESAIALNHDKGNVTWNRLLHLCNTGTFCEFMTEGVSGYGDTKNQVIGTPIGTCTISINAETGKVTGHA